MGHIKSLDQSTILKLAAGEIIDRPVSIVKELVENAIDAGSSAIGVHLKDGGISEILIEDNGSGIDPDDIELAISPHATSKLSEFDDLQDVLTMGFRGEALASIAEVADITILSQIKDADMGIELKKTAIQPSHEITKRARAQGTTITVAHLFKHIPVRFRFLKTPATECGYITKCIQNFCLHHPQIAFVLTNNGTDLLSSSGKGDLKVLFGSMLKVGSDQVLSFNKSTGDITVSGVMTTPNKLYKNRQKCWFSVNQRLVQSPVFFKAVQVALSDIVPNQQYPGLVCNIEMPTQDVDINIHPKKEDVKFAHGDDVFVAIRRAIQSAVHQSSTIWEESKQHIQAQSIDMGITDKQNIQSVSKSMGTTEPPVVNREYLKEQLPDTPSFSMPVNQTSQSPLFKHERLPHNSGENVRDSSIVPPLMNTKPLLKWVTFKNKYIIVPLSKTVLIFDQHAVHERILYDKYKAEGELAQLVVMPLLVPEYIQLEEPWYSKVVEALPVIQSLGIDMDVFDQSSFVIREVPQLFSRLSISDWMNGWLNETLLEDIAEKPNDIIKETLQMKSCKAAVKAGQKLSDLEVTALIEQCIDATDQFTCPHGRPLYIELDESKLDRLFLRS